MKNNIQLKESIRLPRLLVFATGGKTPGEGGSGLKKLIDAVHEKILRANIVGVVSNNPHGGVFDIAMRFGIPFIYSPKGRTADDYKRFVRDTTADFVALSGWLGMVEGLDPKTTFNIHPAYDLIKFGGKGMYGHHVHEAVITAFKRGEITSTGVTMHFVTKKYDDPTATFFKYPVPILQNDTPETLQKRVNGVEHHWQAIITDKVVNGEIRWDGENASSIVGADIREIGKD